MPTVEEEEETLCLLAPDNLDGKGGDHEDATSGGATSGPSSKTTSAFLATGKAEETFYNVCKTSQDEDEDDLEVVNSIIGTLEAEENPASKTASNATSRSLVVDIHLPPPDELEAQVAVDGDSPPTSRGRNNEDEAVSVNGNGVSANNSAVASAASASSARPCKHEVNRFQRCYSDGSQSSPKRKSKVRILPEIQACIFLLFSHCGVHRTRITSLDIAKAKCS